MNFIFTMLIIILCLWLVTDFYDCEVMTGLRLAGAKRPLMMIDFFSATFFAADRPIANFAFISPCVRHAISCTFIPRFGHADTNRPRTLIANFHSISPCLGNRSSRTFLPRLFLLETKSYHNKISTIDPQQ